MSDPTLGNIASTVTSSDADLAKVITGTSEAAGVAFEAASIGKFKVHKDNPTQIPLGTPAGLAAGATAKELASSLEGSGDAESAATDAAAKAEEKL